MTDVAPPSPLAGLRVLDFGIITSGAASSQVLADFGAEVIKIESITYPDPLRRWTHIADDSAWKVVDGFGGPFSTVNRNKRGVALDLKTELGRKTFLELVQRSDIVVENFRRGVLERLGIGFDVLKRFNPKVILLSLSSQGLTGPESGYSSYGSTLEALGGLMSITGYNSDAPSWTGNNVNYPDQLVSFLAPGLVLAAVMLRDENDEGIHVDVPQREAVTSVIGEDVLQFSRHGTIQHPIGNRSREYSPQGVYPAEGIDQWIAISVTNDTEWFALCSTLGSASLANDEKLSTLDGRRLASDEIDEIISEISKSESKWELAEALQEAGVPASPVLTPDEVLTLPQLAAVGFNQTVPEDPIVQRGFAVDLSRTPATIRRRAPRLGEDTREVLSTVLGYSEQYIEQLEDAGAIFSENPSVNSGTLEMVPDHDSDREAQ